MPSLIYQVKKTWAWIGLSIFPTWFCIQIMTVNWQTCVSSFPDIMLVFASTTTSLCATANSYHNVSSPLSLPGQSRIHGGYVTQDKRLVFTTQQTRGLYFKSLKEICLHYSQHWQDDGSTKVSSLWVFSVQVLSRYHDYIFAPGSSCQGAWLKPKVSKPTHYSFFTTVVPVCVLQFSASWLQSTQQ